MRDEGSEIGDETQPMAHRRRPHPSSLILHPSSLILFVLLIIAAAVAGCGRSGPAVCPVSGTVSYNGAAVAEGSIVFIPADKHLAAEGGKIADGHFAFSARAGQNRVEIRATREVGRVIPSMGQKARQSYLPAKYNSESTLAAEVVPGGKNQFPFDLTGPPLAKDE